MKKLPCGKIYDWEPTFCKWQPLMDCKHIHKCLKIVKEEIFKIFMREKWK